MELSISIIAVVVSVATFLFTVLVTYRGEQREKKQATLDDFWESHHEYDSVVDEYRKISGYLARIEHFALGVNTGIYDAKVTERAATTYFVMLFSKMMPILSVKNGGSSRDTELRNTFHTEFLTLVERIRRIEKKKSPYQKLFLSMIDAFKITLRFLSVVVIKEYLDTEKEWLFQDD